MAMRESITHLSCGSPVDYLCIRWERLRAARGVASRRHDLRLDRLVLRIGDELRVEQLLRFAQTAHRITLGARRRRSCRRRSCRREYLDSPRSRPQLLELAHPALLAPGLILGLADAVHGLSLLLEQSLELDALRPLRAERGEIGGLARAQRQIRADHSDVQSHLLEILPADGGYVEAAEELAREHDEPAAGGGDEQPPVREREETPLDRPGLERLAGNQHRAQIRERSCGVLVHHSRVGHARVSRTGKSYVISC